MVQIHNNLGTYVLDERGEPVPEPDTIVWGRWLAAAMIEGRKHLAQDTVGPYWVSTVFLGVDHSWSGGPPILWETMIFGAKDKPFRGQRFRKAVFMERYTSRADALAGHARAVKYAESLPRPVHPRRAKQAPPWA